MESGISRRISANGNVPMTEQRLMIRHLVFTGPGVKAAELEFDDGCNIVWGASNTGKSFSLKALDFMLGARGGQRKKPGLPDIDERKGYDNILLGVTLAGHGDFTLSRSVAGGNFSLYEGLFSSKPPNVSPRVLSIKHNGENLDNLSNFLLTNLGFGGHLIADNTFGRKRDLSFRDLAHIFIVDESSILAERSPVESGGQTTMTEERSVFRFLLSGVDDNAITTLPDDKTVKQSKATRLALIDEMIADM